MPTRRSHQQDQTPSFLEAVGQVAGAFTTWVDRHREEINAVGEWLVEQRPQIEAFAAWAAVQRACNETRLYAPASPAWHQIAEAVRNNTAGMTSFILAAYGPGGAGHDELREEIRSATLLRPRLREVDEVIDSWAEGRHYVTICGALPLVEGLLASTHGRWKSKLTDYPLRKRLNEDGVLTREEEADLILNMSAVDMVTTATRTIWKSGPTNPGVTDGVLNRHRALHGTAIGWDTAENATYAVLLVAAAARVAGPLLAPR